MECDIDGDFYVVEIDGIGRQDVRDDPEFNSGSTWLKIKDARIDPEMYTVHTTTAPTYGSKPLLEERVPSNRKLDTLGGRSVLVVRVIAGGVATTSNALQLSDSVFGNNADGDGADLVNLRNRYLACSKDQLQFFPVEDRNGQSTNIRSGVVTITLDVDPTTIDRFVLRSRYFIMHE